MLTTNTNICQLCRWSVVTAGGTDHQARFCRRNPPFATPVIDDVNRKLLGCRTAWPGVQDTDWCGEFERRCDFETKTFLKLELEKAIKELQDART